MLRVKNIHYIMASLHVATAGNANLRIGEARIPRGLTVQLRITLHDNMGNEILHNWEAAEHLGHAVARRDGVNVQIDADFKLTVSATYTAGGCLCSAGRNCRSVAVAFRANCGTEFMHVALSFSLIVV